MVPATDGFATSPLPAVKSIMRAWRRRAAAARWAGEKQLALAVFALTPQSVKAYPLVACGRIPSLADVPEVAAELPGSSSIGGKGPLLAIGYLDAPRVFQMR